MVVCVAANATLNVLGLTMEKFAPPVWLISAAWGGIAVAFVYSYKDDFLRWWKGRGKSQREQFAFKELQAAYDELPHEDIGDGNRIARLPDGSNIVKRKDGRLGLATPVLLSATVMAGKVSVSAHLRSVRKSDDG